MNKSSQKIKTELEADYFEGNYWLGVSMILVVFKGYPGCKLSDLSLKSITFIWECLLFQEIMSERPQN